MKNLRSHDLKILQDAILLKLYEHALAKSHRLTGKEVASLFSTNISELFVEKALKKLASHGLIYTAYPLDGPERHEIEAEGIERVQEQLADSRSTIAQLSASGDDWLSAPLSENSRSQQPKQERFTDFRDKMVIALYEESISSGLTMHNLKKLANDNNIPYKEGWIREFESFLGDHGYALVRKTIGPENTCSAKLNSNGLEYAESLIEEISLPDKEYSPEKIPASDRVVSLDHNSPEYKEATEQLERLTTEFEADKNLDNVLGPEKNGLINILKGARDLLDNYKIGARLYIGSIIWPVERLQEIAAEHPGATWGAFVGTVLSTLTRLAGLG